MQVNNVMKEEETLKQEYGLQNTQQSLHAAQYCLDCDWSETFSLGQHLTRKTKTEL